MVGCSSIFNFKFTIENFQFKVKTNVQMPNTPPKKMSPHAEQMVREVVATTRVRDIKRYYRLRESIAFKWWESGILLLVFGAALGAVVNFMRFVPAQNVAAYYFSAFWLVLLLIAIVVALEFLASRLRAARQMIEHLCDANEAMERRLKALEKAQAPAGESSINNNDNI